MYNILRDQEAARNNDWSLIAYYMVKHHPKLVRRVPDGPEGNGAAYAYLADLKHVTSAETIIRARRIIQNDLGAFPPTDPEVMKARRIKEKNYTDAEVREAKAAIEEVHEAHIPHYAR